MKVDEDMTTQATEMLSRDNYAEISEALQAIKEGKEYLRQLLQPKLDKSLAEDVLKYIDTIPCDYEDDLERRKVAMAIMLFIFAPEWFVFKHPEKYLIGTCKTISSLRRLLSVSSYTMTSRRRQVCDKYRRKGKFSQKVDYVYQIVSEKYKITEKIIQL